MGKPIGFIEYRRETEGDLAPLDRIHNWDEFHIPLPDDKLHNHGARGITFKCNIEVGKDIPTTDLLSQYDAVVLCSGATKPRDLTIAGRGAARECDRFLIGDTDLP